MEILGKPFLEFQVNWSESCPVKDSFFLGYASGYFGYLPTIQAATEGGYGTASSTTWVQVGAGEQMVDRAVVKLDKMLGLLEPTPGRIGNETGSV